MWHEPGDREVGDMTGDGVGCERTIGTKPLRSPVQRPEKGARGDGRVAGGERATCEAGGDQRPNAPLVPITFGDDDRTPFCGQRIDLEVRGRSFDLGDQTEGMSSGEFAQPLGQRTLPSASRRSQCRQQPVERSVLTEEEDFVLAAEVVIEVRR